MLDLSDHAELTYVSATILPVWALLRLLFVSRRIAASEAGNPSGGSSGACVRRINASRGLCFGIALLTKNCQYSHLGCIWTSAPTDRLLSDKDSIGTTGEPSFSLLLHSLFCKSQKSC